MAKKSKARAKQTPEEIAEERIAEWKRDPLKQDSVYPSPEMFGAKTTYLDLVSLRLKAGCCSGGVLLFDGVN